jgi:hypothetical protein
VNQLLKCRHASWTKLTHQAVYLAIGIHLDGHNEVFGLWITKPKIPRAGTRRSRSCSTLACWILSSPVWRD